MIRDVGGVVCLMWVCEAKTVIIVIECCSTFFGYGGLDFFFKSQKWQLFPFLITKLGKLLCVGSRTASGALVINSHVLKYSWSAEYV